MPVALRFGCIYCWLSFMWTSNGDKRANWNAALFAERINKALRLSFCKISQAVSGCEAMVQNLHASETQVSDYILHT